MSGVGLDDLLPDPVGGGPSWRPIMVSVLLLALFVLGLLARRWLAGI